MNIVLPKGHLSFSQITLWLMAKETYRKKYYPEKRPHYGQSLEMIFGNEVTEAMEKNEDWVSFIPRYETFEFDASFEIDGVRIEAYIDNIDLKTLHYREQKTGRTPWTQNKVDKHLQFDIYSMLLEEQFGKVPDEHKLVWAKTQKKTKTVPLADGTVIEAESEEIELTGEFEEIPRLVTKDHRNECRKLITRVAKEISEDYQALRHFYN